MGLQKLILLRLAICKNWVDATCAFFLIWLLGFLLCLKTPGTWAGGSEFTGNLASGAELCSKVQQTEPEPTEFESRNDKVTQCGIEILSVCEYDREIHLEIHVVVTL
ncbi:hypothetical protein RchiOBHm_Chr4g0420691 [Rosa chinensis]|uniref:Uncharacterized protein n=1 Tax=Rosa chinensis TaxID=74649 RepID=A0A2P6QXX9_ROSCH|nr:hypothetical protein RchiOBHm_Chr4g0420691 [Rosa chinensis]